ncbi:hypothetical protein STAS_12416 [Striga asiatica]|uniref:Uncharacterized protein n=1 Tax=Striga asiatica TaxID=4170 RepID=A0A5A7PTE6_STRAF|nr:hypothetical protein STAS_12416 [Striga asiatica]
MESIATHRQTDFLALNPFPTPTMLRSPSPTDAPPTASGDPELAPNESKLSALENPNSSLPAAEGPLPSPEQTPAESDVLRVSPPLLNPSSKQIPPPPPLAAGTLAAAERSEISRRLRWSITASLSFLALVGVQLAWDAPHGEINPLKLLKVVTSTSAYIFILLLLPFTHHIRKIEVGEIVGIVLDGLFFSVPLGLALYSEDGWELVMSILIFVHLMGIVNSGVVSIKHFDMANTCLVVVVSPLLFLVNKSQVPFGLVMAFYFFYSSPSIESVRDFEAKMKVPEFPEVVWRVKDAIADVWGRVLNFFLSGLHKGKSCVYEQQEKGSGGQAPSKQLGGQTFVGPICDAV